MYHQFMKRRKPRPGPGRVSEPVQVYLARPDRQRLDRLTAQLGTTKSSVLREALQALEQQLTATDRHPALRVIGIAGGDPGAPDPYDIAREHDRYLADLEDERPSRPPQKPARAR
jgi:Arc/MetJ-type ribon-helix-helix transcriptional regulator